MRCWRKGDRKLVIAVPPDIFDTLVDVARLQGLDEIYLAGEPIQFDPRKSAEIVAQSILLSRVQEHRRDWQWHRFSKAKEFREKARAWFGGAS